MEDERGPDPRAFLEAGRHVAVHVPEAAVFIAPCLPHPSYHSSTIIKDAKFLPGFGVTFSPMRPLPAAPSRALCEAMMLQTLLRSGLGLVDQIAGTIPSPSLHPRSAPVSRSGL